MGTQTVLTWIKWLSSMRVQFIDEEEDPNDRHCSLCVATHNAPELIHYFSAVSDGRYQETISSMANVSIQISSRQSEMSVSDRTGIARASVHRAVQLYILFLHNPGR